MAHLELRNISKTFTTTTGSKLAVLDNFSLEVPDGQLVCILGPSGSGKSTILNILAGLMPSDTGTILVDGKPSEQGVNCGYVFQRPRLLNWRTTRQNIYFALRAAKGIPASEWRDRTDAVLRLVGLTNFADEYPLRLSGGMQQRVAIARAWAIEPQILLMDEPFGGLDEFTAGELRQQLLRIWSEKRQSVLFVTHNPREAALLADRLIVVSRSPARILADLTIDIPRPRTPTDHDVVDVEHEVVSVLMSHMQAQEEAIR